jgi:hypothetical protein
LIAWAKAAFPKHRKEIKGVAWGELFNAFKGSELDSTRLEQQVASLMADEDVGRKKGIYSYVRKLPPRATRFVPAIASFHSKTFPPWSNVP